MSETNRNKTGRRPTATSRSSAGRTGSAKTSTASGRSSSQKTSADRVAAVKNARNSNSVSTAGRSTGTNRRRKRRRQSPDFAKLILIGIALVIVVLCIAVGLKGCSKDESGESGPSTETTAEPETEVHAEIVVNGISVNGLTKSEARGKILAAMGWDMNVSYNGDTKALDNLMAYNVDLVLEEAFDKAEAGTYEVTADGLEEQVNASVESLAAAWDVQPKNGSIESYDKATGEFKFAGAKVGTLIDRETLAAAILAAVESGDYAKTIEATATEVQPEITEAEAKASFKRLGTYTTTTTSNKARNENIRIASEALNGMIIQPGEEFSFNLTTGNRTPEKGYQAAGAYVNGVLVEEPGGGVCQVSSTLYNAVVFSGLKTTERHAHSYEPSYVTPGEDAMVSYDGYSGPDMKFINNSKTAVGIKTSFSNQKLTISVYGNPILEEGVTLSMVSTKVKELDPPEPVYEEDPTLELDVEVEVKAATPGSRWVTNLVTKKDGVVIEEIVLHNSTYNGKPATIKRNTSGVVVPTEGESSSGEVSSETGSVNETTEPTTEAVSGPGSTQQTTAAVTPGTQNPGGTTQPSSSAQNVGPGDMIAPSTSAAPGSVTGPGSSVPQSPADMTSPAPGPGVQSTQSSAVSVGPGIQSAETNASPGGVGLISPIG
ncbi:MAG: VanW family protein [Lachnospiraceae bacterium]|nr:VanW family protein [Lachnospiraceae bacterium]